MKYLLKIESFTKLIIDGEPFYFHSGGTNMDGSFEAEFRGCLDNTVVLEIKTEKGSAVSNSSRLDEFVELMSND